MQQRGAQGPPPKLLSSNLAPEWTAACAEGTGRAQGISGGTQEAPKQEEMRSDHSLGDLTARDRFRSDPATRFFKYCAAIPWGSSFMQCGNTMP